jgi:hypothetical protein
MASIQVKMHGGRKYWCIVESKRINGKPRSTVIEYLGTAETLLARLNNSQGVKKIKSYSHGCVAALLVLAQKFDVVSTINKFTSSQRAYWAEQPKGKLVLKGLWIIYWIRLMIFVYPDNWNFQVSKGSLKSHIN